MWSFQKVSNQMEYNESDQIVSISLNLSNTFDFNEFDQIWPVELLKCALVDPEKF